MWLAISCGPVAQFSPIRSIGYCSSTVSAAAMSLPSNIVPVVSIVTWAMIGIRLPRAPSSSTIAATAHLVCKRSWQVSTRSTSAPPATRPRTWSR